MAAASRGGGFIRAVRIDVPATAASQWPFTIPSIASFGRRSFDPAVTYLVGENGSGKSTLVEALAVAVGLNAEGGTRNMGFSTADSHTALTKHLVVERRGRPRTDFFLRAESFFNVASHIDRLDEDPLGGPKIREAYGGQSLHTRSHGESFIATLTHRLGPGGLYFLDEPESALSFHGCLTLLRVINDLTREGSQFVIATHSPIVLASPGALIYSLDEDGIKTTHYDEAPPVINNREFLRSPERFLRHLFADD
ncbi:MAG: AAA family ATPase [Frankiaceae bacterium]|nr:AAA family ATPase [Frankiaceae bacterium]MBV9869077.1 AAA family ATPase [Frankiaceae bacterium]